MFTSFPKYGRPREAQAFAFTAAKSAPVFQDLVRFGGTSGEFGWGGWGLELKKNLQRFATVQGLQHPVNKNILIAFINKLQ